MKSAQNSKGCQFYLFEGSGKNRAMAIAMLGLPPHLERLYFVEMDVSVNTRSPWKPDRSSQQR
jgi:hypothetical protein